MTADENAGRRSDACATAYRRVRLAAYSPLGIAFNLREGMISRSRAYLDHDDALKALGSEK